MDTGLDELIESLLTEIALSGNRGCSVSALLDAIKSSYNCTPPEDSEDRDTHELSVTSQVWRWLVHRQDVSVGENREFNHKSLEEILSLPEENSAEESTEPRPPPNSRTSNEEAQTFRPTLHVSEERQWHTIAGHGPDSKRVPLFEWKALVDIASVKRKGILQGDLVRLTGQDKRSLPTRTDSLAKKGYIIKQPIFERGFRTSKLWLVQFAQDAKDHEERLGLDFDKVDLSKETLTKDLDPLPFNDMWSKQPTDYIALAQAFVALVKAWGLIRYGDARVKMGVEVRVPLMRALAKTCRWLAGIGSITFVAARFPGSSKLFKDCVKFTREPTPAEWTQFRTTPKAHLIGPSERIRAAGSSDLTKRKKKQEIKRKKGFKSRQAGVHLATQIRTTPLPWKPQKPIINATFDIIKRSGSGGSSNAAIATQSTGENFYRYIASMTRSISTPVNSQPPHLDYLTSVSQLVRVGKTMTYTMYAKDELPDNKGDPAPPVASTTAEEPIALPEPEPTDEKATVDEADLFSQFDKSRFSYMEHATLTKLSKARPGTSISLPRKQLIKPPKRKGRPPKKKIPSTKPPREADGNTLVESSIIEQQAEQQPVEDKRKITETVIEAPPRLPGVYLGVPNSLDPPHKRKGRPRRSIVIIFRSDKLKDPSFLGLTPSVSQFVNKEVLDPQIQDGQPQAPVGSSSTLDSEDPADIAPPPKNPKTTKSKEKGATYECEKCGNSWKNSNGLDYHLTKSQNHCNPNFVPQPPDLIPSHRRMSARPPKATNKSSEEANETLGAEKVIPRPTPLELMNLRFQGKKTVPSAETQQLRRMDSTHNDSDFTAPFNKDDVAFQPSRGGIKLKELRVYDATNLRPVPGSPVLKPKVKTQRAPTPVLIPPDDPPAPVRAPAEIEIPNNQSRPRKPLPTIAAGRAHVSKLKASGPRPFSAFAITTKPNASFHTRRRDRTMEVIAYLLEHNKGVFPGGRSLFMALLSVWVKEVPDLGPPDRRTLQNITNQMEREETLKQVHFFFLDEEGRMQEHSVLVKANRDNINKDVSMDPRVVTLKEKLREMHPEAYVPSAFSLSPDEIKLFNEIGPDPSSSNRVYKSSRLRERIQDIEVLNYNAPVAAPQVAPVAGDPTPAPGALKRAADDTQVNIEQPSKRPRVGMIETDTTDRVRRNRSAQLVCDSGKLASYIWSERQKEVSNDVATSPPRDSENGQPESSLLPEILATVKTSREVDATVRRKGRDSWRFNDIHVVSNDDDDEFDDIIMFDDDSESEINSLLDDSHVYSTSPADSTEAPEIRDEGTAESTTEKLEMGEGHQPNISRVRQGQKTPATQISELISTPATNLNATKEFLRQKQPNRRSLMDILPHSTKEILQRYRGSACLEKFESSPHVDFLRKVMAIEKWEQSYKGAKLFKLGRIKPGRIFIHLDNDMSQPSIQTRQLEWLDSNQYTPNNIPDDIKAYKERDWSHNSLPTTFRALYSERPRKIRKLAMRRPTEYIEYKTRVLTALPKYPRGRNNKPAAHDERLGSKREDELIAACVIFKTLLGGIERSLDIGLLTKIFPTMSLSALRKVWPRVSRERKTYVDALTLKFQSAFLEAYETGEIKPLDYDDIENYDWPALILWTINLETHKEVDLPASRGLLQETHTITKAENEVPGWKSTWFAATSTYSRIEAVASETVTMPISLKEATDPLQLARSWVRSLCCTPLRGVNVKERIVPKLLELGNGDVDLTNELLEEVVKDLNDRRVIVRIKNKDLGGNFRLHANFVKQMDKMASTQKFKQAYAFKAQLDDSVRRGEDFIIPYASDDGTIMAILNLQAHGRILLEPVDAPDIPFGFEPGNYEGRFFPKSYYRFKIRLVPTQMYLMDKDMPVLKQAQEAEPPVKGPNDEMPIWIDFFGNINLSRWGNYVCLVVFTLATKGPLLPKTCATLLEPMVEEFEVRLVVEWLDRLGLLVRVVEGCEVTVAEWWWAVASHIVEMGNQKALSDKKSGKKKLFLGGN
ncbi:hypothetical protein F5Y16DRAFT_183825 [Xylariaceae sp. FL0255]|nr:hypothetical protein F5Y16DRAFT_183825 [Xylariaceae sp. FL0255]